MGTRMHLHKDKKMLCAHLHLRPNNVNLTESALKRSELR